MLYTGILCVCARVRACVYVYISYYMILYIICTYITFKKKKKLIFHRIIYYDRRQSFLFGAFSSTDHYSQKNP